MQSLASETASTTIDNIDNVEEEEELRAATGVTVAVTAGQAIDSGLVACLAFDWFAHSRCRWSRSGVTKLSLDQSRNGLWSFQSRWLQAVEHY